MTIFNIFHQSIDNTSPLSSLYCSCAKSTARVCVRVECVSHVRVYSIRTIHVRGDGTAAALSDGSGRQAITNKAAVAAAGKVKSTIVMVLACGWQLATNIINFVPKIFVIFFLLILYNRFLNLLKTNLIKKKIILTKISSEAVPHLPHPQNRH